MTKELKQSKPVTLFTATMASVSMASAGVFVILLVCLHFLQPTLDPTWRFISEYMLEEHGWMMVLAFLAMALSLACMSLVTFTQARTAPGYIGSTLLVIAAVGLTIAAIYPTDPVTTPEGSATEAGRMHVMGASLDWTPFAALLICFSLRRYSEWFPIRRQLFMSAAVPVLLTFAFVASIAGASGKIGPGVYAGLIGRLLMVSYGGWIFVVGWHVRRLYGD